MLNMPQRSEPSQPQLSTIINSFRSKESFRLASNLIKTDAPIMNLHINLFSDVTCVGLSLPHAVVEMVVVAIILRTWCSILADDQFNVPSLVIGNPLAEYGEPYLFTQPGVKDLRASMASTVQVRRFWEKVRYYRRILLELALSPKEHCGLISIPMSAVDHIRKEGLQGLKESGGGHEEWVSEHDITTAILVKVKVIFIFLCSLHL